MNTPPIIIEDEMTPAAPTAPAPKAAAPAPAVEELPVDMDRLNDLTEGNADSIRELVDMFFKQTTQQLAQLEAAVRANKADDVRRVAHSCVGASATLGMTRFVPLLPELEKQGASGTLTSATQLYENARREFKLIQDFLAAQLNSGHAAAGRCTFMKKILIIEDDQIVGNVYRNKLNVEGYQVEVALDGETGLKMMRTFQPDGIVLDLMLPKMSGVEVIKAIRSEAEFSKLPIIVFSNTYLTNLIQDAWKAGATKCVSKINCPPKDLLELMRRTIGGGEVLPVRPKTEGAPATKSAKFTSEADAEFQAELRKTLMASLPATLTALRAGLQSFIKSDTEVAQLKHIHELYRRVHAVNGNAGISGLVQIAHLAAALEALLKELYEKPENINASTLRTVAAAVDCLAFLFECGPRSDKQEIPPASILVVDDEVISRRAIIYALEKAQLQSVGVEDPNAAFKLLSEKQFDLVFLDVDMPGMTGYELCAKLRNLPLHKKTPIVFVTGLSGFDHRASSIMAGGNDFIAKPFLFIELTVKALIHVLRGKFQPAQ